MSLTLMPGMPRSLLSLARRDSWSPRALCTACKACARSDMTAWQAFTARTASFRGASKLLTSSSDCLCMQDSSSDCRHPGQQKKIQRLAGQRRAAHGLACTLQVPGQ